MTAPSPDPTVNRLRDEITALDRSILEAVNARLELVAELKRHKEDNGLPFVDRERERALVERLVDANRGPLSDDGLREFYRCLLDLLKREASSDDA